MRRTQIYLDDDQERRLAERAAALRRTKSQIIRQVLDDYLDKPIPEEVRLAEFRAAVQAAAGSAPYFTPAYLDELRGADRQRALDLEQRWHGVRTDQPG